jgi:hypothetical protein
MGRVEGYRGFWWGNLRERDHLEDPVSGMWGMEWVKLAQDKDR